MEVLDLVMRVVVGLVGAFLLAGAAYMFVTAAQTGGVGMAGTFFGTIGILALVVGLLLLYLAFRPDAVA